MLVHYDLSKSPATWDFANFLARAEIQRREVCADSLHVNIMPGSRDWSLRDKETTKERRLWASRDLLPQMCWALPSVKNVSFSPEGDQTISYQNLGFYPGDIFRASEFARESVAGYLRNNRRPVSISIRQSDFQPQRNSNLLEWIKVKVWLRHNGFTPIWLCDLRDSLNGSDGYAPAVMNADIRLALYEQCELNLMINHGPAVMALMADVPLMLFSMAPNNIPVASPAHLAQSYFHPKADWGPRKKIFWDEDKASNIISRLEKHLTVETRKVANA